MRDSSSFPGAFGLAVRVAHLPPNIQMKPGADALAEHVRFYLIEPTAKGVKLKGCTNEPVFGMSSSYPLDFVELCSRLHLLGSKGRQ